jgi:hypothetical protein
MELAVLQQTRHYFRASTVQNETDRNWRHTCKIFNATAFHREANTIYVRQLPTLATNLRLPQVCIAPQAAFSGTGH